MEEEIVSAKSIRDVERYTGFLRPAISGALNGRYKQVYGYVWKRKL